MPASKEKKEKKRSSSKSKSKTDKPKRSSSKSKDPKEKKGSSSGPVLDDGDKPKASSIDFEAGRFFERADSRGTLDQEEFQRLWRSARTGAPLQPPTTMSSAVPPITSQYSQPPQQPPQAAPRQHDMPRLDRRPDPPPPSELPIPMDFSAGTRFERFDTNKDGHINLAEFADLLYEWRIGAGDCPTHMATAPDIRVLFEKFDQNSDGFLSRGEFLQMVTFRPQTTQPLSSTIPALRSPSPVRVESSDRHSRYCWYDETVGAAVTTEGAEAARNAGHNVVPLSDAYEQRLGRLQEQMAVSLLPKRSRLQAQLSTLRSSMDQVQSARVAVERETMADCDAIIDRLKATESVRLAPLLQSVSEVDSELLNIDRLKQDIDGSFIEQGNFGKTESMMQLIQNYPDWERNIERVSSKLNPTIKPLDPATACQFPRETKKRIDCLGRESKYEEALNVKDRMLWEVMQDRTELEEKLNEEKSLCQEYSNEMSSWVELTERLSREVAHLREVEANSKELENDFDKLIERAKDDQLELQLLRTQRKDFADLMEENCALRQQLGSMERRTRTMRMREAVEMDAGGMM